MTDFTDNACINIYPIGGDFVAASESDVVLSFDPETLETNLTTEAASPDHFSTGHWSHSQTAETV